jgi:hypothetical protein
MEFVRKQRIGFSNVIDEVLKVERERRSGSRGKHQLLLNVTLPVTDY